MVFRNKTVINLFYFNTCAVHLLLLLIIKKNTQSILQQYIYIYISQQSVMHSATCFDSSLSPSDSLQSMYC